MKNNILYAVIVTLAILSLVSILSHNSLSNEMEELDKQYYEMVKDYINCQTKESNKCYSEICFLDLENNTIGICTMSEVNCEEFKTKFALSEADV